MPYERKDKNEHKDKKPLPENEPEAVEDFDHDYENRNHKWTGFEGLIWTNNWYRRQRGPLHRHLAQRRDKMILHQGKLYQAIKRTELEKYEQLTEEEMRGLPEEEFYELTDAVFSDLARMEDAVKRRKAMLDQMKKIRLANELENKKGKVVELTDIVLMLTEQKGRVSWTKVIDRLTEMKPEVKDLVEELKKEYTGAPAPMIKKYPHKKEPKKWKSLEHVPLRGGQAGASFDEMHERRLIKKLDTFLDKWIRELSALLEMPRQMAARVTRGRSRAASYSMSDVATLARDVGYLERKLEDGKASDYEMALLDEYEEELEKMQHSSSGYDMFGRRR